MTFGSLQQEEDIILEFDLQRVDMKGNIAVEETEGSRCPQSTNSSVLLIDTDLNSERLAPVY